MKRTEKKYDFTALGQAIKAARQARGLSREQLANQLYITSRYVADIENHGQHPSLQVLHELTTLLDVSVDQYFFPERTPKRSTARRQLDAILDDLDEQGLRIVLAAARAVKTELSDTRPKTKDQL